MARIKSSEHNGYFLDDAFVILKIHIEVIYFTT